MWPVLCHKHLQGACLPVPGHKLTSHWWENVRPWRGKVSRECQTWGSSSPRQLPGKRQGKGENYEKPLRLRVSAQFSHEYEFYESVERGTWREGIFWSLEKIRQWHGAPGCWGRKWSLPFLHSSSWMPWEGYFIAKTIYMVMLAKDATNLVSARPSGGQVASGRVRSTKNFALHGGHTINTLKHSLLHYCTHRGSLNFFPGMKIPQRQFLQTQSIKSADQQLGKHEMMLTYWEPWTGWLAF